MSDVPRNHRGAPRQAASRQGAPRDGLEVLTRPGCAATPLMHERVVAAAARLAGALRCVLVDITALPPDDERRRYPTPTVLLRRVDLCGMERPSTMTAPT